MSKFNTFKGTAAGREETLRRREVRAVKRGVEPRGKSRR